jgi:hypothetical protein
VPAIRATDASKTSSLKPFPQENQFGFVRATKDCHSRTIPSETKIAYSWEHFRQAFEKAIPGFRNETKQWMEMIVRVFENDAQTVGLSAQARLSHHQLHSAPMRRQNSTQLQNTQTKHTQLVAHSVRMPQTWECTNGAGDVPNRSARVSIARKVVQSSLQNTVAGVNLLCRRGVALFGTGRSAALCG